MLTNADSLDTSLLLGEDDVSPPLGAEHPASGVAEEEHPEEDAEPRAEERSVSIEPAAGDDTPSAVVPPDHRAYQRLALELLKQALQDAERARDAKVRADALSWLTSLENAPDRSFWCEVAGLDPRTFERLVGERLGPGVAA